MVSKWPRQAGLAHATAWCDVVEAWDFFCFDTIHSQQGVIDLSDEFAVLHVICVVYVVVSQTREPPRIVVLVLQMITVGDLGLPPREETTMFTREHPKR